MFSTFSLLSIGMVVWELQMHEALATDAGDVAFGKVQGFGHKEHHKFWHEILRRQVGDITMYELIAPMDDGSKGLKSLSYNNVRLTLILSEKLLSAGKAKRASMLQYSM